jgi:hypothetical protein
LQLRNTPSIRAPAWKHASLKDVTLQDSCLDPGDWNPSWNNAAQWEQLSWLHLKSVDYLLAFSSTALYRLHVSHCHIWKDDTLQKVMVSFPSLKDLELSHIPSVDRVNVDEISSLTRFSLTFCESLTTIDSTTQASQASAPSILWEYCNLSHTAVTELCLQMPALQQLILQHCPKLGSLQLDTPSLQLLDCGYSPVLHTVQAVGSSRAASLTLRVAPNIRIAALHGLMLQAEEERAAPMITQWFWSPSRQEPTVTTTNTDTDTDTDTDTVTDRDASAIRLEEVALALAEKREEQNSHMKRSLSFVSLTDTNVGGEEDGISGRDGSSTVGTEFGEEKDKDKDKDKETSTAATHPHSSGASSVDESQLHPSPGNSANRMTPVGSNNLNRSSQSASEHSRNKSVHFKQ